MGPGEGRGRLEGELWGEGGPVEGRGLAGGPREGLVGVRVGG